MRKVHPAFLIVLVLAIATLPCLGQSPAIKVRFIGNCGLYLTDDTLNVYVDFPYKSGAHKYMKYDVSQLDSVKPNSLFIFTHRHSDHYSKKRLRKLTGTKFDNWNTKNLEKIKGLPGDFSVKAIKTSHKFTLRHYSYVITWHGKRIYFSGDTGSLEEIEKEKDLDWAFVSPWLYMNAKDEKVKIDTKIIGMYHLYPNQKITGEVPAHLKILSRQNETFSIPY